MKVKYGFDGLPLCPDCETVLSSEDAGKRDTETMSGRSVEYFYCDNCCNHYELIGTDLCGTPDPDSEE